MWSGSCTASVDSRCAVHAAVIHASASGCHAVVVQSAPTFRCVQTQVLAMFVDPELAAEPEVAALLDEMRSTFPSCRLDLDEFMS